jgi:integrase
MKNSKIIEETATSIISSSTAIGSSAYNNFLFSIKSETTKQLYIYGLKKYMLYHHFDNVEDLLLIGKEKEQSPRLIEADIIQYIVWLKQDQQLSSISVELYLSSIMHFFSMNDIVLNRKKIGMYIGEYTRTQKDRGYSTEEIHKLLDFSDERSKALVLLLASTGIRIGAVTDLQLRHLKKITQYPLYHITIYEGTKEEYFTFASRMKSFSSISVDPYSPEIETEPSLLTSRLALINALPFKVP